MRPARLAVGARLLVAAIALCAPVWKPSALSVRIAPFVIVDSALDGLPDSLHPERRLLEKMNETPLSGSVEFSLTNGAAHPPVSFLDAARLCELREYPYLLYGYLKKQESTYSSELKLMAREGKHIAATFVATDDTAHYDRLIADLAKKVADYFLDDLAIVPDPSRDASAHDVFEIPCSLGYWTPVGDWAAGEMGLCCVGFGFRFIPRNPLAALRSKPLYLGTGLRLEYSLGKNLPELETSYLHRIKVRIPIEAFLGLGGGSYIGAGLGGFVEFDVLAQDRKYGRTFVETTSAGGVSVSLMYQYALSDHIALGLDCSFDTAFYSRPLCAISPRLYFDYSFGKKDKEESSGAQHE